MRWRKAASGAAAAVAAAGLLAGCGHGARMPRPVWDGRGVYASQAQPLCPAADAGRYAVAGTGAGQFAVRCVPAGAGLWGWDAVASGTGGAG